MRSSKRISDRNRESYTTSERFRFATRHENSPMKGRIEITLDSPAVESTTVPPLLADPSTTPRRTIVWQVLRSAVLVLGSVLVVRAAFIEPYGVPTGSMAPTLIGVHRTCDCPNCGQRVTVGNGGGDAQQFSLAQCPNCEATLGLDAGADAPGDHLLVDKQAFEWRNPGRWEPVVFRVPGGGETPYVKRVVGLPGERIRVHDGDVLINGEPARKSLAQCRILQIPLHDSSRIPREGWAARWQVDPQDQADRTPWSDGGDLVFPVEAAKSFRWLAFSAGAPVCDGWPYNAATMAQGNPVHDFLVSCEISVQRGTGEVAIALHDGSDEAIAILPVGEDGTTRLSVGKLSRETRGVRLKPGKRLRLELALVDRRAILAIDGDELLPPLDLSAVPERSAVLRPLRIGAWGVAATVSKLRVGRDVHYVSAGANGTVNECLLGPNEYYVLGDNSSQSEDSRFWTTPGVSAAALVGKPLFLHHPGRGSTGFDWSRVGRVR